MNITLKDVIRQAIIMLAATILVRAAVRAMPELDHLLRLEP